VAPPAPPPGPTEQEARVDDFDPDAPPDVETVLRLFQQVKQRREDLDRREAEVQRREARLRAIEGEVETQYEALRLLQEELNARLNAAKAEAAKTQAPPPTDEQKKQEAERLKEREANVERLAHVFEKMKPAEAAKVVPQMEEGLAVDVLVKLKERQAAAILGGIEPALAGRLSQKMVDRRKKDAAPKK
jgi:flagellar motility protein MotE (MotC chaperone)